MKKVGDLLGHKRTLASIKESKELVSSRRIGIELEYENIKQHPSTILDFEMWEVTEDGSLRILSDNSYSLEVRFRSPFGGVDANNALENLKKWVLRDKEILCTSRTGLHVHIDFRDLSTKDYRNFFLLFLALEPFLYNYCGDGRENNIFCLPFYKTGKEVDLLTVEGLLGRGDSISRARKYSGANFGALAKKGSVEFRMHPSTTKVERIKEWTNILLSIVEHAVKRRPVNVRRLLRQMEAGTTLLDDVFRDKAYLLRSLKDEYCMETGFESLALYYAKNMQLAATSYALRREGNEKSVNLKTKARPQRGGMPLRALDAVDSSDQQWQIFNQELTQRQTTAATTTTTTVTVSGSGGPSGLFMSGGTGVNDPQESE